MWIVDEEGLEILVPTTDIKKGDTVTVVEEGELKIKVTATEGKSCFDKIV